MTQFQHVHTSNLSATMTASSVALSIDTPSVVERSGSANAEMVSQAEQEVLSDFYHKGQFALVVRMAEHLLVEAPRSIFLLNILGETYARLRQTERAVEYYSRLVEADPDPSEAALKSQYLPNVHNNLCIALKELGLLDEAEAHVSEAIRLKPDLATAYNSYGTLLNDRADLDGAQKKLLKAIELDPDNHIPYWNLQSTVNDVDHAKEILELCLHKAPAFQDGVLTLAGLRALSGDPTQYEHLMEAGFDTDPLMRSVSWMLSLPNRPELHFNRWSVFDRAVAWSANDRPFYEFGVWMGDSFRYLRRSFPKGYGFDTFSGLPEDWRSVPQGSYSSFGRIPRIDGAEFIVGEFSDTLPKFFARPRPQAALMNFDADLYSSTLCALQHARPTIDDQTVLIFDEFIVNSDWEHDEYRALEEFCAEAGVSYKVLAASLFTKQVVCHLEGL